MRLKHSSQVCEIKLSLRCREITEGFLSVLSVFPLLEVLGANLQPKASLAAESLNFDGGSSVAVVCRQGRFLVRKDAIQELFDRHGNSLSEFEP